MTMTNQEALLKVKEAYDQVLFEWRESQFVQDRMDWLVNTTLETMSPEMLEKPAAEEILNLIDGASELQTAVEYYEMAQERLMESEPGWTPESLIESIQETA